MAKRSALYPGTQMQYAGGVGTMQQAQSNVFAPSGVRTRFGLDLSSAHTWAWLWFAGAVGYLFFIYFGHGGRRGGAL
jgi:hypothetical protein